MEKYIKISIGIFLALAASRFIPHPPNFTSLLALSFYVPVIFGIRFLPALLISFAIADLIIGYHSGTHWTWGSVLIIGIMSQYFNKNLSWRFSGALVGAVTFFVITNFGVWSTGMYGFTLNGFFNCYLFAIPFFGYSLISTIVFSLLIEITVKLYETKLIKS